MNIQLINNVKNVQTAMKTASIAIKLIARLQLRKILLNL